jgi:hypothetical protein
MKTTNTLIKKLNNLRSGIFLKITLVLILVLPFTLFAQRNVEKRASIEPDQAVNLEFKFADKIDIKTWNNKEVLVKVSVNINDNQDNDAFNLTVDKYSSGITFESEIEDMDKLQRRYRKIVTKEDGTTETHEYCSIDFDLFFEVFLPPDIPLSINTISGDIEIGKYQGELDVKTISGFIDLSLDSQKKADLEMSTISGEIYSNMDLDFDGKKPGLPHIGGTKIEASLNSGGTDIELKTISGDIFLRKGR